MKSFYKIALLSVVTSIVFSACGGENTTTNNDIDSNNSIGVTGDGNVEMLMSKRLEQYNIPAMAVVTVNKDSILEKAVYGKTQYGSNETVTFNDLWNIGSITKSMTATLAGIMVDQGYLGWDTTISEIFPELIDTIQTQYKDITLIELLSHTSGLPEDEPEIWNEFVGDTDSETTQHYDVTQEALVYESEHNPGEYLYSNINYVVVASLLEKVSGLDFKTLIKSLLFEPLAIEDGQIGTENLNTNAQGHVFLNNQWVIKKIEEIDADNVAVVAPAGSQTYLSLDDMAKYLQVHLKAKSGEETFLMSNENFEKLHTKIVSADEDLGYALGWYTEADYGLQHSGSNGRWYALSFINSNTGFGYFIVVNGYKEGIEQAVFEMIQTLVQRSNAINR